MLESRRWRPAPWGREETNDAAGAPAGSMRPIAEIRDAEMPSAERPFVDCGKLKLVLDEVAADTQGVRNYDGTRAALFHDVWSQRIVRPHMSVCSTFHAVAAALLALELMTGCATTSPNALAKYQPPPAGEPAAVINVGKHGRAWSVDGAETPSFAEALRLVPGEHRVGINCLSYEILAIDVLLTGARAPVATPVVNAKTAAQFVLVTGPFEANKTYYTRCVTVNGEPRAWLADAPAGRDLPQGFTSICTRECPRSADEALSTAAQTRARMDPEHPLKIGGRYYPPESLKAREQGRCIVSVTVGADGWLRDASIQQSTGYARMDQACLDAVAGGHFIPATENGKPIERTIALPIVWSLP